jgi:hypothetical protein
MDVDESQDAEALRRKLQKLDDERNRVEARISQQRRAERQPPPRRSQPTRTAPPQRREVYYRPGRGPNDSNDERASETEILKDALGDRYRPQEADAVARKRQLSAHASDADTRRSKRLFGGLVGHLASARKNFEKDETKLRQREEKSSELKIKREETLKRESRAAARHRMCEAKYKDQARRDEILTDMRRTEASLLHASWKASHDVLRHTIRTQTEPSLCWVPAVSTPMTDLLLAKSAERVDAELALGAARCEDERRALQAAYDQRKKRREDAQKRNDERFARPVVDGVGGEEVAAAAAEEGG